MIKSISFAAIALALSTVACATTTTPKPIVAATKPATPIAAFDPRGDRPYPPACGDETAEELAVLRQQQADPNYWRVTPSKDIDGVAYKCGPGSNPMLIAE